MTAIVAIVLAAGKGTRMGSDRAKVLHELHGEPLVAYPIRAAVAAGADRVVVVIGHQGPHVRAAVETLALAVPEATMRFATQAEQLGTGHAVGCALAEVAGRDGLALILSGDVPLVRAQTLRALAEAAAATPAALALATFRPPAPTGYGRIVRDADGRATAIVEERDASDAQRAIGECNAGIYAVALAALRDDLPRVGRANASGEVYLTDLVALAATRGEVAAIEIDAVEAAGVNTPEQLAALQVELTRRRDA